MINKLKYTEAGKFEETRFEKIHNAVFEDSPLVETTSAIYMGASIAYIFYTQD